MKKEIVNRSHWSKLLAFSLVIVMLLPVVVSAPIPAHMELEGESQGWIEGSCEMEGREETILVWAMDHEVSIPLDDQSLLPTGRRVHHLLTITKEFDKSSPKLYEALCTGEHLSLVIIKFYRVDPRDTEEHYYTITLEDAIIVSMRSYFPNVFEEGSGLYKHMEDVSFTYKRIVWTWEPDGIESEDDLWLVP